MKERAIAIFPFAIAVVIPLAGLLLALVRATEGDREQGMWLGAVSLLAGVVWVLVLTRA